MYNLIRSLRCRSAKHRKDDVSQPRYYYSLARRISLFSRRGVYTANRLARVQILPILCAMCMWGSSVSEILNPHLKQDRT